MFETSLAASRPQPSQRNRKLLPVAVAVHGALLAGVVLAGYWSVSQVPEPDAMIGVVFEAGGPPPPLGGGERPRPPASQPERQRPAVTPPIVQPPVAEVPDAPPIGAADDDQADGENAALTFLGDGGGGTGVPWGVPGGTGSANAPGDGLPGSEQPMILRAGMTPPQLLRQVMPRYSESARRMRREGSVFLEAIIGKDGRVANVRVLRGLGFGLDEEAVAAVSQWAYRPARLNERVIAVYLTVRVDFTLR